MTNSLNTTIDVNQHLCLVPANNQYASDIYEVIVANS